MLGELDKTDIVNKIRPLFERGYYIDGETGKVTHGKTGIIPDLPWIFIKPMTDAQCKFYHEVCLGCFKFIHSRCMHCWKVVFRPATVADLMEIKRVMQDELFDIDSKLGIEERTYVHGNYGCYWYGRSKYEGLENYERVRKVIMNNPKLRRLLKPKDADGRPRNLILKRACTEFEMRFGDSREWETANVNKGWESALHEIFEMPKTYHPQPWFVKDHIVLNWLKFAYERGDKTALEFNEGNLFYPDYVKYHPRSK